MTSLILVQSGTWNVTFFQPSPNLGFFQFKIMQAVWSAVRFEDVFSKSKFVCIILCLEPTQWIVDVLFTNHQQQAAHLLSLVILVRRSFVQIVKLSIDKHLIVKLSSGGEITGIVWFSLIFRFSTAGVDQVFRLSARSDQVVRFSNEVVRFSVADHLVHHEAFFFRVAAEQVARSGRRCVLKLLQWQCQLWHLFLGFAVGVVFPHCLIFCSNQLQFGSSWQSWWGLMISGLKENYLRQSVTGLLFPGSLKNSAKFNFFFWFIVRGLLIRISVFFTHLLPVPIFFT